MMKKSLFMLFFVLVCCSGCFTTYIGSKDLYSTDPYTVVAEKNDLSDTSERAIAGKPVSNGFEISFYTKFKTEKKYEAEHYYLGREYFYYDRSENDAFAVPDGLFWFPPVIGYFIILCGDAVAALQEGFSDWRLYGDNLPGIGYMIAYTPIINLFVTPFLRAPYVYKKGVQVKTERKELSEKKLVEKKVYYEHVDDYEYDSMYSEITVTCGKVSKDYYLGSRGEFTLNVKDFLSDIDPEGKKLSFSIYHKKWNKKWTLTVSPLFCGEMLRDWNIMVNNGYDYLSRVAAAGRLSQFYGKNRCRNYLKLLLNDQLNKAPVSHSKFMIQEEKAKKAQASWFW